MKKLPFIILLAALIAVLYFGLHRYFTFEVLREHHHFLLGWNSAHPILAALIFIAIYILAVALSLPVAIYLNITAGLLFGMTFGAIYAVIAASVGATIIFLAVNSAFGTWLETQAQDWVKHLEEGFQHDAFNYLLTLRLIPVIPFWVTNIVAALLDVRLRTFVIATTLGVIPETILCAWMGSGLEHVFRSGKTPSFDLFFTPAIYVPFMLLAMLPLIPLIYKKIRSLHPTK